MEYHLINANFRSFIGIELKKGNVTAVSIHAYVEDGENIFVGIPIYF